VAFGADDETSSRASIMVHSNLIINFSFGQLHGKRKPSELQKRLNFPQKSGIFQKTR
jgi:hypothetical protein